MREFVIDIDMPHIRNVGCHDVVRHIHDEIHLDGLLLTFLPFLVQELLLLAEFFDLVSDVEAGEVVIIGRALELLELQEIPFDLLDLLNDWGTLVLVYFVTFDWLLALLKVGLGVDLFHDFEEGVLADASHDLVGLFGVGCEDAHVVRVLFGTALLALLHY